uniref:Uncharacterized protein n=1 Tax=Fundulus heteroclitus TaxID=8078 RepID=A0A3Q2UNJ1_FUNHE
MNLHSVDKTFRLLLFISCFLLKPSILSVYVLGFLTLMFCKQERDKGAFERREYSKQAPRKKVKTLIPCF